MARTDSVAWVPFKILTLVLLEASMSDLTEKQQWPVLTLPPGTPTPSLPPVPPTRGPINLQLKSLKITAVLSPADLPAIADGVNEVRLELDIGGHARASARLNPKSYRRAWRTIGENGAENVSVILQGRMTRFGQIEDAGLAVNVKTPKPAPSESVEPQQPPSE